MGKHIGYSDIDIQGNGQHIYNLVGTQLWLVRCSIIIITIRKKFGYSTLRCTLPLFFKFRNHFKMATNSIHWWYLYYEPIHHLPSSFEDEIVCPNPRAPSITSIISSVSRPEGGDCFESRSPTSCSSLFTSRLVYAKSLFTQRPWILIIWIMCI